LNLGRAGQRGSASGIPGAVLQGYHRGPQRGWPKVNEQAGPPRPRASVAAHRKLLGISEQAGSTEPGEVGIGGFRGVVPPG
jgi:hypothetical protein